MQRRLEQRAVVCLFHHVAEVHDRNLVGDVADDRQVVRDEEVRVAALLSQIGKQGMPLLTESKLINCIDLEKLNIANVRRIFFMLNKFLQDYDSYPDLFDSLQRALKRNLDTESTNKLRIIFLKEMGFLGDFNSCKECGSTEDLRYLCKDDFALFCKNCYSKEGGFPLGDSPYTSTHLVKSLDEYIKRRRQIGRASCRERV